MLLSLLFLIILAIMAFQSQKILISGIVFGALKALASCFYFLSESEMVMQTVVLLAGSQFIVNAALGTGIAYLVVKHSQNWKLTFVTSTLSACSFLTSMIEPMIVA